MRKYLISLVLAFFVSGNVTAQNVKRPDSYNYTRGVEAYQNNNTEEALDYLNKEIAENPENGYAFSWIALMRYYQKVTMFATASASGAMRIRAE